MLKKFGRFQGVLLVAIISLVLCGISTVQATPEVEEITRLTDRYIISVLHENTLYGEAINNISDDNNGIYIEDITEFGIEEIEYNDIIEVEYQGNEIKKVERLDLITYKISKIEYIDDNLTDGHMYLEPMSSHENIIETRLRIRYDFNTRYFINEQLGEWMNKYDIEEIEEGDILQITIDNTGVSRILTIH